MGAGSPQGSLIEPIVTRLDSVEGKRESSRESGQKSGKRRRRRRPKDGPDQPAAGNAARPLPANGNRQANGNQRPPREARAAVDGNRAPGGQGGNRGPRPGGRGANDPKDGRASSGGQPRRPEKPRAVEPPEPAFKHVERTYGVAFFDTFAAARAERAALAEQCKGVDQLNIIIRAEGDMDDPELLSLGNVKVFAGNAWTIVHERRKEDGWYDAPR